MGGTDSTCGAGTGAADGAEAGAADGAEAGAAAGAGEVPAEGAGDGVATAVGAEAGVAGAAGDGADGGTAAGALVESSAARQAASGRIRRVIELPALRRAAGPGSENRSKGAGGMEAWRTPEQRADSAR